MKPKSGLSAWELTFIALGTVIGGSFFLGSAIPIRVAGPASLLSFVLGGVMVYIILSALSEMTVADPAPGSFRTHAQRMLGPFAAFVVGWVYWSGLTLAMSSEAVAVAIFLRNWASGLSVPITAAIVVVTVTLLNLLGAKRLATLESGLAAFKLLAIAGFVLLAFILVAGLLPGKPAVGFGALRREPLLPGGVGGIAGSMLIVMFAYAGFEVIGLASSEARDPHRTIPRAIAQTTIGLVLLYTLAVAFLLPLVRTRTLSEQISPFVQALQTGGVSWASGAMSFVLVTAILSTMLAAMFGLGRMLRSLAEEGQAPAWLREEQEVPRRGILLTGLAMLVGTSLAFILPKRVYVFLVSSGGFTLLFSYIVILLAHNRFRRQYGCPPNGRCRLVGFPYTSVGGLVALVAIIASMPLVPGQGAGLLAGLGLVGLYSVTYLGARKKPARLDTRVLLNSAVPQASMEIAREHGDSRDRKRLDEKRPPE